MSVVVLACAGCREDSVPRDLEGVVYIHDLCRSPGGLTTATSNADRIVMIVHPAELSAGKVQRSVRAAGFDPLGVQFLSADSISGDTRQTTVLIGGASARAAAFAGSRPEHARPRFGGRRTRRDLLSVPIPHYEAIPMIDETVCAASDGCRACVAECPQSAYRWSLGDIAFDRESCVTCGRCITACPTGAIGNPTVSGPILAHQITALVEGAAPEPLGIAFVCRQRTRHLSTIGWAEVEVPCTGMVPATWPIAALLQGAAAAAVIPCSDVGCGLGNETRAMAAVTLARDLVGAAGHDREAVLGAPGPLGAPFEPVLLDDPFGVHGPAEVAMALHSSATPTRRVAASGPMAFRGVVSIDGEACTLCLTCAETCPTGALGSDVTTGRLAVSFDAALCTGCMQCAPVCPELERGAISVERCIDTDELQAGSRTLAESETADCELCGAPIAPAAMLSRIAELLGDQHDATMTYLERRCMNCRGTR